MKVEPLVTYEVGVKGRVEDELGFKVECSHALRWSWWLLVRRECDEVVVREQERRARAVSGLVSLSPFTTLVEKLVVPRIMIIRRLPQLARSISTTPPLLAGSRLTRHRPPVRRVLKPSFSAATAQHAVAPASSSGSAAGTSSPTSTPPATATEGNAAAPTALKEVVSTGLPEPPATAPTLPLVARIPVEVPHDELGVIDQAQGEWAEQVRTLFATPAIVVARQLEMMNVLLGFEEANKCVSEIR